MTLSSGTNLGPYKILAPIGQAGQTEVYRARDARAGRDVTIQVVSGAPTGDPRRVKRFEEEARAAGALRHPNVAAILDVGIHDGTPYVVMEPLEGETLRERISRGAIRVRNALEYGVEASRGLAAAHEKGMIHRDLKPENLFLTNGGGVKLLGFGCAHLTRELESEAGETLAPVTAAITRPELKWPDPSYMSPEQATGCTLDPRSDLFTLGSILHEMLSGKRPFDRGSLVETLGAILNDDPPRLPEAVLTTAPGLGAVVRRCLDKEPSQRFQSAHDVAVALEVAGTASGIAGGVTTEIVPPRRRHRLAVALAAIVLLAVTHAGVYTWGGKNATAPVPSFTRITFQRGEVGPARFTPDGRTVVYAAGWQGRPHEVFVQRLGTTDARALGIRGGVVVAAFGSEVAVRLPDGSIARVPLEGGTPRQMAENVRTMAWSRDGKRSLAVRYGELGGEQLECPVGKVIFRAKPPGAIARPQFSPAGDRVAFIYRPTSGTHPHPGGEIRVVDLSGRQRTLSKGWVNTGGLNWSADGREVWFTAGRESQIKALHAVTLSGRERLVLRVAGDLTLNDIASDGRVLLNHGQSRWETRGRVAGSVAERDLTWLDGTWLAHLSPDGRQMVAQEGGEGGGATRGTYYRKLDGSPPVRLFDGWPYAVSPDWKRVLCGEGEPPNINVRLVPIGAGEAKSLPRGIVAEVEWCGWHPDGKRIVILGHEAGRPARLFIQDLPDGLPRPFTPEGTEGGSIFTPDGRFCMARPLSSAAPYALYPIEGGEPRPIPGLKADDEPQSWSADGKSIFLWDVASKHPAFLRMDIETGRRTPWLEWRVPDRAGVDAVSGASLTPDGRYYIYYYHRNLSDLFLVEGLR